GAPGSGARLLAAPLARWPDEVTGLGDEVRGGALLPLGLEPAAEEQLLDRQGQLLCVRVQGPRNALHALAGSLGDGIEQGIGHLSERLGRACAALAAEP